MGCRKGSSPKIPGYYSEVPVIEAESQESVGDCSWYDQRPKCRNIVAVAGDSLTMRVRVSGRDGVNYPDTYVSASVRSLDGTIDAWFVDRMKWNDPFTGAFNPRFGPGTGIPGALEHLQPHSKSLIDPESHLGFDKSAFSPAFRPGDDITPYLKEHDPFDSSFAKPFGAGWKPYWIDADQYGIAHLTLLPKSTRFLYTRRWESPADLPPIVEPEWPECDHGEPVGFHCYHLPVEANVPPTSSGYPESSYGPRWQGSVRLPVLPPPPLPEVVPPTKPPGKPAIHEGYKGQWDLQIFTADGKFVRTLLSGTINVVGDVTAKVGIDV